MKPLSDLVVIELSTMITASFAAMMLAEQGARVIKVEPIHIGDPLRLVGHSVEKVSAIFASCNRGKESIRVNLKSEAGVALIKELAADADVILHNYRPGVMDKLGLGSAVLRASNPKLVFMAISGFGTEGPLSKAPAYDPVIQAQTGMTDAQGKDGHDFVNNLICDKITAYTACQSITAALYLREKTGVGQHIDLSMMDASLFYIFPDGYMANTYMSEDVKVGIKMKDIYHVTPTSDGRITYSAGVQKQTHALVRAVGREDLLTPEGLVELKAMLLSRHRFDDMIDGFMCQHSTVEALEIFKQADVPSAECLALEDVIVHPQIVANQSVREVEHPELGRMRVVPSPARFGGEQLPLASLSPMHGEHTRTVIRGMGKSDQEIDQLVAEAVIAE